MFGLPTFLSLFSVIMPTSLVSALSGSGPHRRIAALRMQTAQSGSSSMSAQDWTLLAALTHWHVPPVGVEASMCMSDNSSVK